jgi:hypothetical protein
LLRCKRIRCRRGSSPSGRPVIMKYLSSVCHAPSLTSAPSRLLHAQPSSNAARTPVFPHSNGPAAKRTLASTEKDPTRPTFGRLPPPRTNPERQVPSVGRGRGRGHSRTRFPGRTPRPNWPAEFPWVDTALLMLRLMLLLLPYRCGDLAAGASSTSAHPLRALPPECRSPDRGRVSGALSRWSPRRGPRKGMVRSLKWLMHPCRR